MIRKHRSSGRFKTLSSFKFTILDRDKLKSITFPAEFFVSPQFYYKDVLNFESQPKQIQTHLAGTHFIPLPMKLPKLSEEQKEYVRFLKHAYRVGNVFVPRETLEELVRQETSDKLSFQGKEPRRLNSIFEPQNYIRPETIVKKFNSGVTKLRSKQSVRFTD